MSNIHIKKNIITHPINIFIFLFVKPIVDIFYSASFLDYLMIIFLLVLLFRYVNWGKVQICSCDIILLLLMATYSINLLRNFSGSSFSIYAKIISSYLMYFLGRFCTKDSKNCLISLKCGFLVAFAINVAAILLGYGTAEWGTASTIKGLYYFKTDMAVSLLFTIMLLLINEKLTIKYVIVVIISSIFLLLTNARISYFVFFIFIFFFVLYRKELKGKIKNIKINLKVLVWVLVIFSACLYLLQFLGNTSLFSTHGFISVSFSKISDLLSGANTQGRSIIWEQIISTFNQSGIWNQIFGVNINSNIATLMSNEAVSAHNMYLATLYQVGFFGTLLYVLFWGTVINKANCMKDRTLFYVFLMCIITYFMFGISVNTNEFTNYSWITMFVVGLSLRSSERVNESVLFQKHARQECCDNHESSY